MKKILITGAGSYIGTSFEAYLTRWPGRYQVDTVDMKNADWREYSFAGYDAVYHVAGIAHSDSGPISPEKAKLYYRVNTDLAVETARKAKQDGAKQFIFMSSAIIYGGSAPVGREKVITRQTIPVPANSYGDSKLQAEKGILPLQDETFKVVILRPPMVYGRGCRGNYSALSSLAQKLPVFPRVENCRSMIYIENLLEFVRLMVENEEQGIFWPQNEEYSNTALLAKTIAQVHGKKLLLVPGVTWALKLLSHATALVDKAFGSLCYDRELSRYSQPYCIKTLKESIEETEGIV